MFGPAVRSFRGAAGYVAFFTLLFTLMMWFAPATNGSGYGAEQSLSITRRNILFRSSIADLLSNGQFRKKYAGILPAGNDADGRDALLAYMQNDIDTVLTDTHGWAATGAKFTAEQPGVNDTSRGSAEIVFRWMYRDELSTFCSSAKANVCVIPDGYVCTVALNIDDFIGNSLGEAPKTLLPRLINIAAGYCFGLTNSATGLMSSNESDSWRPSADQIDWVRDRLS